MRVLAHFGVMLRQASYFVGVEYEKSTLPQQKIRLPRLTPNCIQYHIAQTEPVLTCGWICLETINNLMRPEPRGCFQIKGFAPRVRKTGLFAKGVYSYSTRLEKKGPVDADIGQ